MERDVDPWPLRHLVLRTPRLELRPDDDAGLLELVDVTDAGIHDPGWMPFKVPWTQVPRKDLGRNTMQYYWSMRASLTASQWVVNFLVRVDGRVIGNQGISSRDLAIRREVQTGSWIGKSFQGEGIGRGADRGVPRAARPGGAAAQPRFRRLPGPGLDDPQPRFRRIRSARVWATAKLGFRRLLSPSRGCRRCCIGPDRRSRSRC
jgi:hypothetical protein